MYRRFMGLLLYVFVLALALSGCASQSAPTAAPTIPPTAAPTVVPTATPQPQPSPEPTPTPGGVDVAWELVVKPDVPVVARVNGVDITTDAYLKELRQQLQYYTAFYAMDWNSEEAREFLPSFQDQLVQRLQQVELAQQLAKAEGIELSTDELKAASIDAVNEVMRSGRWSTWQDFVDATATYPGAFDKQVQTSVLFDKLLERHGGPDEVEHANIAQIAVTTEDLGKQIVARLQAGASFADLAKQYSTDGVTKSKGGEMGWVPRGLMVPEWDAVAFSLEAGEISDVFQTEYGFHVLKSEGKETRVLSGEQATQVHQAHFLRWFDAEIKKADIETLVTFSTEGS